MASPPTTEPTTLWRNRDFLKLWSGESLSLVGSQVTVLAMPIVAYLWLNASVAEMGVLGALARLPMVLFFVVGVWVDRMRRRPVLIWSDVFRAFMLATVPVLFAMDMLTLWWLYVVVFAMGVAGVLFEIAYRSYLPILVPPEHLGDGNSKLQLSDSVSKAVGPSLAGVLIATRSAPLVILVDAVSYVLSALCLISIRKREDPPPPDDGGTMIAAIRQGFGFVMSQPIIRPLAIASAVYSFFDIGILQTLYIPYVIDGAGVPAGWVGAVLAVGGIGAIAGAWLSVRLMKRAGPGPTMFWSTVVGNSALILVPLAGGPLWLAIGILAVSQLLVGLCTQIFVVNNITVLQSAAPRELVGRVIATIWAMGLVPAPLGALVAGLLGQAVGMRPVVLVAAVIGAVVPMIVLARSPIPKMREMPQAPLTS
ncbi:MFS transporter [Nonomuraea glycinis]|uniref:MFS transporter n=1 Tax=Nonomuraea glycinis TaxID=2047744 RepID=A0A918E634_9ACTN|nr:MFS transporter [Nonomuraea glycinis]MCA2177491.1 MFS transporter [Nonomuraea glycinis]GGP09410.1 MFS transporter [Nonomuraea glycinis]